MTSENEKIPVITKIETQKRAGRYNVYLDGRYAFPVSEDVLVRFRLFKGSEVNDQLREQLENADQQSQAWGVALGYISYQQRTEKETIDYLVKKEYDPETIDAVVGRLKEELVLNDKHYAYSYVRTMRRTSDKGPTVIRRTLQQKHVAPTYVDEALADEYDLDAQLTKLAELVPKLQRQYRKETPRLQRQKVQKRLVDRGYSFDVVGEALNDVSFEMSADDQAELMAPQAEKLWRRYRAQPESQRKMKVRQALYRKGFSGELISAWFEGLADE